MEGDRGMVAYGVRKGGRNGIEVACLNKHKH